MTAAEIRESFLKFFADRGHHIVPSSSLVPADDPTLLFTNAGMNQFKEVFAGREHRSYTRAVSVQKCVRAGGKHNDLEQVGHTARHQTFFEMLGNWSFGDYFKREAIDYAWTFVTEVLGLKPDALWVTVYHDDDESAALWQEVAGVPAERIVRLGDPENFWSMGDVGPCGPCTELFIDRGAEWACGPNCGIGRCDCDRFEEFWNLVFILYDRQADGTLTRLPFASVDTGMGLERMAAILNDLPSNFETDVLFPLIQAVEQMTGRAYSPGPEGLPFRVVADHVRCITMLMADGVQFSNRDRGYVMRRILRRAVRYGRLLGLDDPFLYRLVPVVSDMLGAAYPEVTQGLDTIATGIRAEEERFHVTLASGLERLEEMLAAARPRGVFKGDDAFLLYDTYGFPLDLTQDAVREAGLELDREGFDAAMNSQRARARVGVAGARVDLPEEPPSLFLGYDTLEAPAEVGRIICDGETVAEARAGDQVIVYFAETPFYAESGGQVGDHGVVVGARGRIAIHDVQKMRGAIWHWGEVVEGVVSAGEPVALRVDAQRRAGAMRNHTGTHLLHAALRTVLGPGARQTGSLVAPDRLRFDFSHPAPLSVDQLLAVEDLVNQWILEDRPVTTVEEPVEEALAHGAIAFFGDKYGERVRVVEVPGASKELCGGTHCRHTGQIGQLRVVSDVGIGSGMRRIEAVTGVAALERARDADRELANAAAVLKSPREAVPERVQELVREVRQWERRAAAWRKIETDREIERLAAHRVELNGLTVLVAEVAAEDVQHLREMVDGAVTRHDVDVVLLGLRLGGRVNLAAGTSERARASGVSAQDLVTVAAPLVGGGGGGRQDRAQAGGKAPEGLELALAAAKTWLGEVLRQGLSQSSAK